MTRFGVGFIGGLSTPGNDAFTKILLHMDGSNGGTTFTDIAVGGSAKTWTPTNATTSTASFKFGTASMLTASGYITTPDHSDFTIGSNDFTLDLWINFSATTGNASGSVSAPNAPRGGSEILGLQMIGAQKTLIEAQTEKTKAEAEKISGVDTRLGETQIESLTQGVQNAKAVEALTKVQTGIAEIEQDLKIDSYEDVLNTIKYQARAAEKQLQLLTNEKDISDATKQAKIDTVQAELIGLGLANELKKLGIQLTEEQIKKTRADVAQGWKSLNIQERNAAINMLNSEIAQQNANTNMREFLEQARNNRFGNQIAKEALALQKFLNDVPESTKIKVHGVMDVIKILRGVKMYDNYGIPK